MTEDAAVTGFADAHMHIVDVGAKGGYPDIDYAALLLSCTASFDEWEPQRRMAAADTRIRPFYGVHPWHAETAPADYLEVLRGMLEDDGRAGVGEIGIDKLYPEPETQMRIFVEQMETAAETARPATVHMVKTEAETLRVIRMHSGDVPVILHSYAGDPGHTKAFSAENCYFSISSRILRMSQPRAMRILSAIPDDRLLVETDAPIRDHAYGSMGRFLIALAALRSTSVDELVGLTTANTLRAIG